MFHRLTTYSSRLTTTGNTLTLGSSLRYGTTAASANLGGGHGVAGLIVEENVRPEGGEHLGFRRAAEKMRLVHAHAPGAQRADRALVRGSFRLVTRAVRIGLRGMQRATGCASVRRNGANGPRAAARPLWSARSEEGARSSRWKMRPASDAKSTASLSKAMRI